MQDTISRFIFENTASRGVWVKLSKTTHDALLHHDYPPAVQLLLNKAMATSCLLASSIKFSGKTIVQLQTNGKAPLVLAQCNEKFHVRALARIDNDSSENAPLLGDGTLSIILSPDHSGEPYQGVVDFHQESISSAVERYFQQSEQLATKLYLASDKKNTVGLLLQRIPGNQYEDVERFEEITLLANTLSDEELLAWDNETLLTKVFNEHDVRLLPSDPVKFKCSCSDKKIEKVLFNLGKQDLDEILSEHPYIEVHCDFCNKLYTYTKDQVETILDKDNK